MKVLLQTIAALVLFAPLTANAGVKKEDLARVNASLQGRIVDYTHNHGCDHRIPAPCLGQTRDLYVYLPPGYDGVKQFPLLIFMHGLAQDETIMLVAAPKFDAAIVDGSFPPCVIAMPDGSLKGHGGAFGGGSFFLNAKAGRYEDFMMQDVYPFLRANFAIRPEKEAHVFSGASMGGFSAYNLAIKYSNDFQLAAGILPLLNLRYCDCHGDRFGEYNPDCLGWLSDYRPHSSVGWVKGLRPDHHITIREKWVLGPIFTREQIHTQLPRENPIEMLDLYDVKPDTLKLFVAYTQPDPFKADAQAFSFIAAANRRGIHVDLDFEPGGHNMDTGLNMLGKLAAWLKPRLDPYVPK